jgi:hypothetical protein
MARSPQLNDPPCCIAQIYEQSIALSVAVPVRINKQGFQKRAPTEAGRNFLIR